MDKNILLSVIIPTCSRKELLAKCLDQLAPGTQTLTIDHYQVIVTDDSSDDATRKLIQTNYPWVIYSTGPKKGPSSNRNNGAKDATGDWLIFTDDDCVPNKDWLENYKNCINKNSGYKVFEGKTIPIGSQSRFDQECPVNVTGGLLWSCNFCIRKDYFTLLRGFDEAFPFAAMEDIDLRIRILETEEIFFCSSAIVQHPWVVRNSKATIEKHFQSTLVFLQKHPAMKKKINGKFYLTWIARDIYFNLLKNGFRYKFRGISFILMKYWLNIKYSYYLTRLK